MIAIMLTSFVSLFACLRRMASYKVQLLNKHKFYMKVYWLTNYNFCNKSNNFIKYWSNIISSKKLERKYDLNNLLKISTCTCIYITVTVMYMKNKLNRNGECEMVLSTSLLELFCFHLSLYTFNNAGYNYVCLYLLPLTAQKKGPVFIDPQYGDSEEDEVVDYQDQGCPPFSETPCPTVVASILKSTALLL